MRKTFEGRDGNKLSTVAENWLSKLRLKVSVGFHIHFKYLSVQKIKMKPVKHLKYFSDLSKLLKSELSEFLNIFDTLYYKVYLSDINRFSFTKDERERIAEARKTAKVFIAYRKKYGMVGRGFNNFE